MKIPILTNPRNRHTALGSQSASFGREEIRNYYRMVDDENQKSFWTPMDLCGRIGSRGKKMMLAAFLPDNRYTASEIASAFTNHHYSHLTFALGGAFKCNAKDIQKSVTYLESIGYEWHVRYNEKNRAQWEDSAEAWREIMHWVKELEKGIPEEKLVMNMNGV